MDYGISGQSISLTVTAISRDSQTCLSGSNTTDPKADISGPNSALEQSERTTAEAQVTKLLVARQLG